MDVLRDLYLALSTIFFFWLGRLVWTLRNTVKAQASTIGAFKTLLDGMKAVLDSTDEPAMLKRMKAYREIVDHEMEAYKRKVNEEKRNATLTGASAAAKKMLEAWKKSVSTALGIALSLLPYVPPDERPTLIDSMDFGEEKWMKELMTELAPKAPYTPPEDLKRNREAFQNLIRIFETPPPPPPPLPKKD